MSAVYPGVFAGYVKVSDKAFYLGFGQLRYVVVLKGFGVAFRCIFYLCCHTLYLKW